MPWTEGVHGGTGVRGDDSSRPPPSEPAFRHEALLYGGIEDFVAHTGSFITHAVADDEPVLVVVSPEKIALLREHLGDDAERVLFMDMMEIGRNPARIIPAWRDFVSTYADGDRPIRGVGEPITADRTAEELVECHRHEALLNLAFARTPRWWLLCPYDVEALPPEVIEEAHRTHAVISRDGTQAQSEVCRDLSEVAAPFDAALPQPPGTPPALAFRAGPLRSLRTFIAEHAKRAGLPDTKLADFLLAAHEIATNSVRHGGGGGVARVWRDGDHVVCELQDTGLMNDPLVGRERPATGQPGGRGLWLVNQLCDLVQIRSLPGGTVVRLRMSLR